MKLPFKIKQVKPRIFLFEFTDQYNMNMHFLRYQEFYESPNPKFRNKSFTIFDFMEWQAKTEGNGNFTYPTAWSGFNIPSNKFYECLEFGIDNINKYDENMDYAFGQCVNKLGYRETVDTKFYIIGALKGNEKTLQHEICHGLFYLNTEYKKEATKLVKALPKRIRISMEKMLTKYGYTKQVFIDEINAYFSTDTKHNLIDRGIKANNKDDAFKLLFEKFNI